jgi:hypothetical protein
MDNLYKSKKKENATCISTSDVLHPNVSPLAPKSIRLNLGKHVPPMKQQQDHMYEIACIPIGKIYAEHNINPLHRY